MDDIGKLPPSTDLDRFCVGKLSEFVDEFCVAGLFSKTSRDVIPEQSILEIVWSTSASTLSNVVDESGSSKSDKGIRSSLFSILSLENVVMI